jgi:Fic family protein
LRSFSYLEKLIGFVPSAVVRHLADVDVGRGTEALYRDQLPGVLQELAQGARVASITASSAIEGVIVADAARARQIIAGSNRTLRDRDEQELAGYRDALDYLCQRDWRPLNVGLLLHLHRLLFGHTAVVGGSFKTHDNLVVDRAPDGTLTERFRPVPASDTEFCVNELVHKFNVETTASAHHPVLLIGLFVLDLLVIHPFEDGNGRVARAVTNALLADAGYAVVRYVSLEQAVADSADDYYQALLESTHGWHSDGVDPWPWLEYFVRLVAGAYDVFGRRAASARSTETKQERVRQYVVRHAPRVFRLADIRAALPGVSDPTIRLVLDRLRREGVVHADGVGRSTLWRRST